MKKMFILIGALLLLFIVVTGLVITNNTLAFDNTIYNYISSIRCDFLDVFFKIITKSANVITVICLLIILLLVIKDNNRYILGITAIITTVVNNLLKVIIMRPRPSHEALINQSGYSYPSGHTMISVAIYGFLIYYTFKKINDKKIKTIIISLLTILIILIGISRIYLGVHYPSDVIGGYLLSLTILISVIIARGQKNDKIGNK